MLRLLAIVLLLVLLVGSAGVWIKLDVPVRAIRVQGPLDAAEREAVQAVVARALPAGLLSLDLDALRRDLHALSWPRRVTVRRVWPATLAIGVEKEMLVAAWGEQGYLTTAAKVVELPSVVTGVPRFSCELASPKLAMEVFQLLQGMAQPAGLEIGTLQENSLGEWEIGFASGASVMLGSDRLAERMHRFIVFYQHELAVRGEQIERVDARYTNGVAVRWQVEPSVLELAGTGG